VPGATTDQKWAGGPLLASDITTSALRIPTGSTFSLGYRSLNFNYTIDVGNIGFNIHKRTDLRLNFPILETGGSTVASYRPLHRLVSWRIKCRSGIQQKFWTVPSSPSRIPSSDPLGCPEMAHLAGEGHQ